MATHSCLEAQFPIHSSAEEQTPRAAQPKPSPQTEILWGTVGVGLPRSGTQIQGGDNPSSITGDLKTREGWDPATARVDSRLPASGVPAPVVAVEVVQPAAFLDELDGARAVAPGGVAVQPLVPLALAALQAALVGALQLPVGVVVDALPCLGLPAPRTCAQEAAAAEPPQAPGLEEGRAQTGSQCTGRGSANTRSSGCLPATAGMSESPCVLEWGGRVMLDMPIPGPSPDPANWSGGRICVLTTPFVPGGFRAKLGDHFGETRSAASCPWLCLDSAALLARGGAEGMGWKHCGRAHAGANDAHTSPAPRRPAAALAAAYSAKPPIQRAHRTHCIHGSKSSGGPLVTCGPDPQAGLQTGAGHNPTLLPPTAAHNIARLLNMLGFQASHKLLPLAARRSPLSPLNVGSSLSLEARPITLHFHRPLHFLHHLIYPL